MAGTLRGKIDCLSTQADANDRGQEVFKAWFDFMENLVTAGVVTRIAFQFGDGSSGSDYHDGSNPFETGAFGLYRWAANGGRAQDLYMLGQYGTGTTTTDGDPILVHSGTVGATSGVLSFAFASALESDDSTVADPWENATRNNDGTDLKGLVAGTGPVWGPPGGGSLAVWPVSNQTGFSDGTNKENTVEGYNVSTSSQNVRFGFLADDDNFFMYTDEGDNLDSHCLWVGPHIWATGITPTPLYDLAMIRSDLAPPTNTIMGDTTGNSLNQGGLFSPAELGMRGMFLTTLTDIMTTDSTPSNLRSGGAVYEEFPVYTFFKTAGSSEGQAGTCDTFIKYIFGVPDRSTKPDLSRIVFGTNSSTAQNWSLPWDSTTTPGTTLTRGGVEFP